MSVSARNRSQYAQALQKTARFLCAGEVAVVDADPLLDEEKMCSRGAAGQPEHGSEEGEGGRRSRPAAEAVNVWSLSCLQPCSAQLEVIHCKNSMIQNQHANTVDFQEGKRKQCFNTSNL